MKITPENPLERAVLACGGQAALAAKLGLNRANVCRWLKVGRMPRTELTGETDYAAQIAPATDNRVSRRSIIEWTREAWRQYAEQNAA